MDVLRRHLLRCGADVRMVSLSDVHESHVLVRAFLSDSSPAEVASRFHDSIKIDLKTLDIEYDDLINPLVDGWTGRYEAINRELLSAIIRNGDGAVRTMPLPYLKAYTKERWSPNAHSPAVGEPVVSGWLKGRCPECGQHLVGFFCETCGSHLSPQEMTELSPAHFNGELELINHSSYFLALRQGANAILSHLANAGLRSDFFGLAKRYLDRNGASIRLTVPSSWGISVADPQISPHEVIWSYSALLYGCHVVAGERYRELTGAELNPLHNESDVTCLIAFGIDNAVPFLVGTTGCALAHAGYKPFDSFLVNYFYDLDGAKFSTSRGHVIWGGDIVTLGGADSDLVRAYLCQRNPEFARTSFDVDDFLKFHNTFGGRLGAVVQDATRRSAGATSRDDVVMRYLEAAFAAQSTCLSPPTFDLGGAFNAVKRWVELSPALAVTADGAATWLAGFALLSAPVMPQTAAFAARRVVGDRCLSLKSLLSMDGYGHADAPAEPFPLRVSRLTRAEFNACLPAHMRG
jgi:methionyl-tRNA synthetase